MNLPVCAESRTEVDGHLQCRPSLKLKFHETLENLMERQVAIKTPSRENTKRGVVRSLARPSRDRAGMLLAKDTWDGVVCSPTGQLFTRTTRFRHVLFRSCLCPPHHKSFKIRMTLTVTDCSTKTDAIRPQGLCTLSALSPRGRHELSVHTGTHLKN